MILRVVFMIIEHFIWSYTNSSYGECETHYGFSCGDGARFKRPSACLYTIDNSTHPKEACQGKSEDNQNCNIVCPGKEIRPKPVVA